jgi:hypothetical protein
MEMVLLQKMTSALSFLPFLSLILIMQTKLKILRESSLRKVVDSTLLIKELRL